MDGVRSLGNVMTVAGIGQPSQPEEVDDVQDIAQLLQGAAPNVQGNNVIGELHHHQDNQ